MKPLKLEVVQKTEQSW